MSDPREIVKVNLEQSIRVADRFERKTGYAREQVLVAFYATKMDQDPQVAQVHSDLAKRV